MALIVAGGRGQDDIMLKTVEVMNTETLQWSTAANLLEPQENASLSVCGDYLYMLGGLLWSLFCAKNTTSAVSFCLRILYDLPSAFGLEQPPSTVVIRIRIHLSLIHPHSTVRNPHFTVRFRLSAIRIHLSLIHPHSTFRNPHFAVRFRLCTFR